MGLRIFMPLRLEMKKSEEYLVEKENVPPLQWS